MKKLFILELKKLAKKRRNIIVITVCFLLIGILFFLPVRQFVVLDTDGMQMSGMPAIALNKKFVNTYAGKLTNDKIGMDITVYQTLFDNPDNISKDSTHKALTDNAYFKYVLPYLDYWKLINGNYIAPYDYDASFSAITNMDLDNGIDFYAARDEKVNTLLNQEYVDWNFSDIEKTFWRKRISSISTPYEYSYHTGWETLFSCMEIFVIGIMGICICVAGIFIEEYQSGADSIILSSRYGKTKLVTAKILAAFVYSLLTFTVFLLTGCGILLAAFGIDGWNLPIQVMNTIAPYNDSLLGATMLAVTTLYFVLFGMVAVTLLLSAKLKSSVSVLATIILVMMLPVFLGLSETNGIWNRILVLLPYRATQPVFYDDFYGYLGYPIGGMIFDVVTVRIVVYAVIAFVCIPFVRKVWKKHQVT